MTSLTESVIAQLINYNMSWNVWLSLKQNFSFHLKARIIHIHTQLATATKGASPTIDYFFSYQEALEWAYNCWSTPL